MKWVWLGLLALVVIVVTGLIQNQNEGFATINVDAAKAQRQQLQLEGERRYNDFARLQTSTLPADAVSDALNQIIPVSTSTGPASRLTAKSMGLFGAADDGTGKSGSTLEQTGILAQKIAFCESVTDTACGILTDPRYSECGICHKDGVNSKGKNFRGGMFISADDQIRANEVAKINGTRAQYKPTVGTCDSANFTVMEETCKWKGRTMECEAAGVATLSNECGQCFGGSGAMLYTGAKPTKFTAILNVSHPGFQNVGGNGLIVENLTTGEQTKFPSGSQQSVLDPKEAYLQLQEGDNLKISIYGAPIIWCAWFSSADGKRIVSLDNGVQSISPQNAFVIAGDKRSKKITKPMAAVSGWEAYKTKVPSTVLWYMRRVTPNAIQPQLNDCTPGGKLLGYPSGGNRIRLYSSDDCSAIGGTYISNGECLRKGGGSYSWDCRSLNDTTPKFPPITLNVTIPATLADPFYDVDLPACPAGPMVLTEAGAGMMGANSCFKANGSFNPTINCLTQLFEAAGGTSAGTLYPDTAAKAAALVVNGSLDDTIDRLNDLGSIALYGTDNNGAPSGFAAQKDAALKFLGIVMSNPCDGPTSSTGPHSAECLNYLWKTSGNAAPLGNGVNPDTLPYDYCHPAGTEFPLKSESNQQAANDKGSVQAIRNYYNGIFVRSQDSSDFDAQAAAMRACYGVKINKPSGPPPVCPPSKASILSVSGSHKSSQANGRTYYFITGSATFTASSNVALEFFAIGGGGGSGTANGGGAGGVQTNAGVHAFASQVAQINISPGTSYTVAIGSGGTTGRNGGDTTISGPGVSIRTLGGAHGGTTGVSCPAASGGCGGGGCPSTGLQGGSNTAFNAGGGAGGNPPEYSTGGPGIRYNGVVYGAAAPNASSVASTGAANTGNAGANGGAGGSGILIISVPSEANTKTGADGNYRGENGTTFTINGNRLTGTGNSAELTGVIQYIQDGSNNGLMVTSGKGDRFLFIHKGNTLTTPSSGTVYTRVS